MRQKYYLEATSRRLQDSCPDQACCLLLVYSLSHNDKSNFEETCPYCFQLLVLDNSQAHLKPNPNSHTKNQNTETSYSRKEKVVKIYKDSKNFQSTYIWTVNTHLPSKECEPNKETLSSTKNVAWQE
uniref:Uncharacterized protein n=1 Tax=Oryctolagus cuniculus TaxID=9986 RepID=A0A5F9CHZ8_RABIT